MVERLEADPGIGMAGPRLVLPNGKLDLACRRSFPSPEVSFWRMTGLSKLFPRSRLFGRYNLTYLDEHVETEVDCVVGAFMMVRREAVEQVGLLDEAFWMYGEDIDWAYRIKRAGWKVLYYPRVTALHVKRAASRNNPRTRLEFQRASLIFYRKHYAATTPRWLHMTILAGLLIKGGRLLWHDITNPA
jgi:GT2 family glycosyltransferase